MKIITPIIGLCVLAIGAGCASTKPKPVEPPPTDPANPPEGMVRLIEYEKKTQALLDATANLETSRNDLDDQRRRVEAICVDYPDHHVCQPHTAAMYARKAFCEDKNFTGHVDEIVKSCHEGACKEVDEAQLLSRTDYMTLVQRLPHKLVLFNSADTRLDRKDKKHLQEFVENIRAGEGYIIIVGRASKDGPWRDNLRYALDRAEGTRQFLVDELGMPSDRVGYITYGHEKMYLTELDAQRLAEKKMSPTRANRSALVFTYPCYN